MNVKKLLWYLGGGSSLPDYIGSNLYDEWIGNDGVVLRTVTSTENWFGRYNNEKLDRGTSSTWAQSANGVFTKSSGALGSPQIRNRNTGISGSVTFAMVVQRTSAQGSRVDLVQASGDSPSMRCEMETQATGKLGLTYAGTTYSTGQSFLFGGDFHVLVFVIDSAGIFRFYMDGIKYGGNISIPAGGINWTSAVTTRGFFEFQFVGKYRKLRIYKEALSDENALLISNPVNNFFQELIVSHRPVVLYGAFGQSNQQGSTMVPSSYPAYLQDEMDTAYYFANIITTRPPKILAGTFPTPDCGPFLAASWKMQNKYSNCDIILYEIANASQSLDVYFNSRTPGAGWTSIKNTYDLLNATMICLGKTVQEHIITYIQGERDSDAAETEAVAKRYNHYFEQVNNNGGSLQLQFNGVDKSSSFTVGTQLKILSDNGVYNLTAEITESTFSTNTLVTVDSNYVSAAPGGSCNRGNYKNFIDDCFSILNASLFIDVRVPHDGTSLITNPRLSIIRAGKNVMINSTTILQLNVDDEVTYPIQAPGNVHFTAIGYENIGLNQVDLLP